MVQFDFLYDELDADVSPSQRARGEELFQEGYADIIDARPGLLRAAVDTERHRYKVKIDWGDQGYTLSCSCGTRSDRVCEHIWAAVLTAFEDGYFGDIEIRNNLRSKMSSIGFTAKQAPPADKKPRWKEALNKLAPNPADAPPPQSWRSNRPCPPTPRAPRDVAADHYTVQGTLDRAAENRPLPAPIFLTADGLVFWGDIIETFDDRGAFNWLVYL